MAVVVGGVLLQWRSPPARRPCNAGENRALESANEVTRAPSCNTSVHIASRPDGIHCAPLRMRSLSVRPRQGENQRRYPPHQCTSGAVEFFTSTVKIAIGGPRKCKSGTVWAREARNCHGATNTLRRRVHRLNVATVAQNRAREADDPADLRTSRREKTLCTGRWSITHVPVGPATCCALRIGTDPATRRANVA